MSVLLNEQDVETERLMEKTEPLTATPSFPLESLPPQVRQFVEEGAEAFPAPVELLAVPIFVSLGAPLFPFTFAGLTEESGGP